MSNKIKSIQKGIGEDSIYFSTDPSTPDQYKVDEIKRDSEFFGYDGSGATVYYSCFEGIKNKELVFTIMLSSDLVIIYEPMEANENFTNKPF